MAGFGGVSETELQGGNKGVMRKIGSWRSGEKKTMVNIENESATDVVDGKCVRWGEKPGKRLHKMPERTNIYFFSHKSVAIFVFCLRNNKMESKKKNLFMNVFT